MERRPRGFFRGVFETLAIVGGFVAFGIAAGSLTGPPGVAPRGAAGDLPYLVSPMEPDEGAPPEPRVWLVDGFNALHVALLAGRDRSQREPAVCIGGRARPSGVTNELRDRRAIREPLCETFDRDRRHRP